MRIVRISELSEEEKRKIKERQKERQRISEQNRINANNQFNELIAQNGEYSKPNRTSLWEDIQNIASGTGKIGDNLWQSLKNGVMSYQQTVGRAANNTQADSMDLINEMNKRALEGRLKNNPEEDEQINNIINNPLISGDKIREESKEYYNKIQERKNENSLKIQRNTESISNPVGKYIAGEIAPGIGQMLPGMVGGPLGTTYFIGSATGNYYDDALQRGMSEDQATMYSGVMGIIEGSLEDIGAKLTTNVGKQLLKRNIKGALVNYGLDIGENFLEESIVEPISELVASMAGGKDKADWNNIGQRMMESGVAGAVTSAITGGASAMIGGIGSKLIQQNQYVDYNTNKKLNKDSQNWLKQAENIIQENNPTNLQQNSTNNQNITQEQQITQQENKTPQNGISEYTNDIMNNKELPMQNYQYEKSDNPKINNLRQDASKYFNNTEKARNFVNMLEKIITDKNIDIRLDTNLKTSDGKIANGSYSNGTITINPNSTRTGEFIAVHELTHAIGTDSMKNIIETYRKSNPEFNSAVTKLLQNYNSNEITEEVLSDVSAQLFGNQEFINNVAQNNPNIFKKIYSEIKYLWHQFRGYKNQDQFIEDLYYKWTQAYNSNNKLNEMTKYSRENDSKLGSYWQIENSKDLFKNVKNKKELQDKAYKYILNGNDNFEYITDIIDNKEVKFIRVSAQEYIYGRNNNNLQKNQYQEKMRMAPSIDDLIENADIKYHSPLTHINKLFPNGYNNYQGKVGIDNEIFRYIVRVGKTGKGDSIFYDVSLELLGQKNETDNKVLGTKSSSLKSVSSNNSISSSSENVNTTKYSIQESENKSDSFNLQKNTFDVSGNENLVNAQILFYRTREDGQYYVQATDGSGKITYDGVFYGEKQLAKSLGEEIAKKIVNTSENINNEIYLQSDNIKSETDYMMAHRPTETGAYASNITKGTGEWESLMPEDVYEHPEWYFDMNQEYSKESFKVLKQIKNNPNAVITIYRATTGNKINVGDWVTLSKKYAEYHNNSQFNGKGNIIELKVKAKDVQYAGDDINEFGYFPQTDIQTTNNSDIRFSQNNETWQQYLNKNFKMTGTRTNLEDIKLPIGKNVKSTSNMQNTENNSEPFRTSEEIANDTKISDLDAIKEESEKINMPTMEKANETANQIGNNVPPNDNTPKSPTIDLVNKKRSKEKPTVKEIKDTLAQKFINKGHYIDKLAKETGNKNLTYLYDRTMNVFNEAQISIGDMQVITNESRTDVEVVGKSIIDIFSKANNANLSKEFDDYLLNKHNIARYAHEKGVFGKEISATDSQNIVNSYEAQHPEFIEWSKEVSAYNDNNLKDLVRNGLVSQETYDKLREMYGDYVPTFRDITDNVQQYVDDRVGNNTLGRATQSDKTILSVKESMAEQTLAIKRAIRVNNFGVELYKTLGKDSKVNESVSGIDFDPVAIQTLAGNVIDKATDGTNTFMIFKDGEMTQFKISDELYSAFSKDTLQNKINNNDVAKAILTPVEKLNKVQRELLTTYSIGFAFNNPIKDFQDALFNTKYSSTQFLKNYTKALYNIGTNGSWYENYKNNGGTANTYFDYDKGILPTKTNNLVKKFANKIKTINEVLEQAPRLAEYISTIENGGSIDEALYNAADITTNFKRGGDITKAMNKYGANFLNASVQGLDKFYRNLSGQNGWKGYAKLAVKATIWQVAPAVLNGLLLGDDDDYEDLPEYAKDNYFLFKIGNGKFFRIPKGRLSSVVGGIARRSLETAQGKEVDWSSLVDTTINQMAPNNPLTDNLAAPVYQAITNKTWYGGEIVSSRLQKLPVAEQYDESTDKLSKFLGEKLNISPKKINYVLDQYSGGVGDVLLPMMTPQAENNILEDKFTTDPIMKNKNVSEYYNQVDELEKKKNSINATDEDKLKYKYFTNSASDLSELYNQKREIQNSDMTDKEKKEEVRKIQQQINDIVEEKLTNVNNIQISGDTAQVGGTQYYKYKGEWKELSEEEKTKGISLKTYANYQNKVAKISNQKKANDESITKKDKINILTSSNYSSSEKDKIYSQIIDKDDEVYSILKKLDDSKSIINQYLDYLQTDLKADREDDGTENGKAISGSKKQKVYNYINSIDNQNMSYVQRLYLTGVNTTLNASDKKKIFSLINENKSLTQKEKLEALDKLQGFTVYTNGTVKY